MKKKFRVKRNEEFTEILNKKRFVSSSSYVIYYANRKEDYARGGISVPKKMGDAVDRNRIKRQIRMMLQDIIDFDNGKKDFIVIARKGYLDKSYEDNRNDLEMLCKKAII